MLLVLPYIASVIYIGLDIIYINKAIFKSFI